MNDRCSVCGREGVLYLVQLVGAADPLCKDCLREVSEATAACVRAMKDRHLLARVGGERHTQREAMPGWMPADGPLDGKTLDDLWNEYHRRKR